MSTAPVRPTPPPGCVTGCLACARGEEHCRGVLLLHADGGVECSEDPGCDGEPGAHDAVRCADLVALCGCGPGSAAR